MRNEFLARAFIVLCLPLLFIMSAEASDAASALDRVQRDGVLRCGVTRTGPGLAFPDEAGQWQGFFPDFCRVVAAAATGDAEAVEFMHLDVMSRFTALQNDQVDIVMANSTWTTRRDAELGLDFPVILYYDGAGFLAKSSLRARSLDDIDHATVCVNGNTTTYENLMALIASDKPNLVPLPLRSLDAQIDAFSAHKCDMMIYDRIGLMTQRHNFPDPKPVLFPEIVSKEPLAPIIRDNDPRWADAVRWAVYATITAEELNLTRRNITTQATRDMPEIARFVDTDGTLAQALDLPGGWSVEVVKQVGNYGEIFARNIGKESVYNLPRGLNALWKDGGLLYAPPMK